MGDAGASTIESISQASTQSCGPEPVSSPRRTLTVHSDMSVYVIYSSFCQMVKVMHHCKEAMRERKAVSSILTESTCISVQYTDLKYFNLNGLFRMHFITPAIELQIHWLSCKPSLVIPAHTRQISIGSYP